MAYQIQADERAKQEFDLARSNAIACPKVFLVLAEDQSRELHFREAADLLEDYLRLTPRENHARDRKDLRNWRRASLLKDRVDRSARPSLTDLVELVFLIDGYGDRKGIDAVPYAEKALQLYPNAPEAILSFVDLTMAGIQTPAEIDRIRQLLDRAVTLAPANAKAHSMRGHFDLWWLNQPVSAEMDFRRALKLSRNLDTLAWKGLGNIYMKSGRKQQAISAFRTYLRLLKAKGAPVDTVVRHALQELEKVY